MMMMTVTQKERTQRKHKNIHMYTLPTQTRTVTYYKIDLSSRQGARPMTNKTATVLTTAQNLVMSLRRAQCQDAKTDGQTDRLTVSCKVTLIPTPTLT
jgi:hypothetical protein